jgi:hypothetical protein
MPAKPTKSYLAITLAATFALYLASLSVPAIKLEGDERHYGWAILIYGWFGILKHEFAWLANPLLLLGLVTLLARQNLLTCVAAVGCIALGLLALRTTMLPTSIGNQSRVVGFTIGYYLWMGSFVALLIGAFMQGMASRQRAA